MGSGTHVVTGAYSYTGHHIARALLDRGHDVRTLTNRPRPSTTVGEQVPPSPLDFDDPVGLVDALGGASVLYNTYWVRFDYEGSGMRFSHDEAVANSQVLFDAAVEAGVERVVHVSVTNPSTSSDLSYFRGKAEVEERLRESGLSYAILRPALLFGREDVLVNNIAWLVRTLPVFGVAGDGQYRLESIFVAEFAEAAIEHADGDADLVRDIVGPEVYTFEAFVHAVRDAIGARCLVLRVPDRLAVAAARLAGYLVGDVVLIDEELEALQRELLYTGAEPFGETRFDDWARANADVLGATYTNDLDRRRAALT